jgi:hypothetical protein
MVNGIQGLLAPVHLPHGATVTAFIVYFYDNSITENLILNLFHGDHTGINGNMALLTTSGTPGNSLLIQTSITSPVIDNSTNYYYVYAHSSTGTWTDFNLRVTRIQINYTVTKPD